MSEDIPNELQVVYSYLEDVEEARKSINKDNALTIEQGIKEILNGDLRLVYQALDRAEAMGTDVRVARAVALYQEGRVQDVGSIVAAGGRGKKYVQKAIQAYLKSVELVPDPLTYYSLGQMYIEASQKEEARAAFKSAVQGGGPVGIEAQKELGRLDAKKEGGCMGVLAVVAIIIIASFTLMR